MNNKIREGLGAQAIEYNGRYVSLDKSTQKIAVHLPDDQSVFMIQSSDLSHIFGCDLEKKSKKFIISGKGPHYPQYSMTLYEYIL